MEVRKVSFFPLTSHLHFTEVLQHSDPSILTFCLASGFFPPALFFTHTHTHTHTHTIFAHTHSLTHILHSHTSSIAASLAFPSPDVIVMLNLWTIFYFVRNPPLHFVLHVVVALVVTKKHCIESPSLTFKLKRHSLLLFQVKWLHFF